MAEPIAIIKIVTSVVSSIASTIGIVQKGFGGDGDIKQALRGIDNRLVELQKLGNDILDQVRDFERSQDYKDLSGITALSKTARGYVDNHLDGRETDPDLALRDARLAVNQLLLFPKPELAIGVAAYVTANYVAAIATLDERAFAAETNRSTLEALEAYLREGADLVWPRISGSYSVDPYIDPESGRQMGFTMTARFSDGHNHSSYHTGGVEARTAGERYVDSYIRDFRASNRPDELFELASFVDELGSGRNLRGNNADNVLAGGGERDFIRGEGGNDLIRGGANDDALQGGAGRDRVYGQDGDDYLIGGADHDILVGGRGENIIDGGTGFDTASYEDAARGVTVSLLEVDFQNTGVSRDWLIDVERLTGSRYADRLTGDQGVNILNGAGGNDRLFGGAGNDELLGGPGNDVLDGGSGNDSLTNGTGVDRMIGGPGADRFVIDEIDVPMSNGRTTGLRGDPTIVGFDGAGAAAGDRIDLSRIDGNRLVPGEQSLHLSMALALGAFTLQNAGRDASGHAFTVATMFTGDPYQPMDTLFVIEDGRVDASAYTSVDFIL